MTIPQIPTRYQSASTDFNCILQMTTQEQSHFLNANRLSYNLETQAKILASTTKNLPQGNESNEFDKRVKIAELMLKEADMKNKSKIVELQMAEKRNKVAGMEEDFLDQLTKELIDGRR